VAGNCSEIGLWREYCGTKTARFRQSQNDLQTHGLVAGNCSKIGLWREYCGTINGGIQKCTVKK
jgi:hypothetical protein